MLYSWLQMNQIRLVNNKGEAAHHWVHVVSQKIDRKQINQRLVDTFDVHNSMCRNSTCSGKKSLLVHILCLPVFTSHF